MVVWSPHNANAPLLEEIHKKDDECLCDGFVERQFAFQPCASRLRVAIRDCIELRPFGLTLQHAVARDDVRL